MSAKVLLARSVWGITVGDVVRSSYGSHGQITDLTNPHYVSRFPGTLCIRTWPVIDISFHDPRWARACANGDLGINDVRQEGERYFTDQNDEVFIERVANGPALQMAMFEETPAPEPYPFRPGVDYTIQRGVYRCQVHGDYNGDPQNRWQGALCPICGHYPEYELLLMPPRRVGGRQASDYQYKLGVKIS